MNFPIKQSLAWSLIKPFIYKCDPEKAHALAISGLKTGLSKGIPIEDKRLYCNFAGLNLKNPLGMAAGFDKNAEVPDAVLHLGFGFTEIGTLTPLPQEGNPKPRLFRLVDDEAVINRMGFNNDGHNAAHQRLLARRRQGIVGVNIGANKTSQNRIDDYVQGISRFYDVADYFTVNISSPNTPGLRDLQARSSLNELLNAVTTARANQQQKIAKEIPIFLKIAPDLDEASLDDIAEELLASSFNGVIISNTTLSRSGLRDKVQAKEAGGLSGKPLFERSTIVLAKMRKRLGKDYNIIGAGGIHNGETALEKIKAGADLVQLYSSMVYEGPFLAGNILRGLLNACEQDGVGNIHDYRDAEVNAWAARQIDP
ncbi:quinone-dependent dihydroorotate dehydrogenase [Bartonella sp. HY329]|uniref:quinone-dependent dihydroorotate dehydrogenase n=1 Tax=unclassified Bartonella TaxID=2645622 RepID=UPI0021C6B7A7|nr:MULTISPECIES: quinone-dependent dihydroorotate dehydrogenase [unclassified Bartonella]UXM95574.1 quinone-dependent dihydroorotate dehydrogenase [Bartonella sp. HY329]UXN09899.1 quinone-dependent dihydroorotate dehydrogenase [Bartonella sp. HY328]